VSELLTIGRATNKVISFAIHPDENLILFGVQHGSGFEFRIYRLSKTSAFPINGFYLEATRLMGCY